MCCAVCGKGENIFSDIENIEEILWSGRNKDWGYRDIEVPYTEVERKSADNRKAMSLKKFIMIDDGIEGDLGEKVISAVEIDVVIDYFSSAHCACQLNQKF